ncbi:hypothetical protein HPB50_018582 [Hyalomma asiaticum]|uniref:Uncharacterized protein n=1 Tax=Hyalomma asiaticum TaxID=266040 RepID=A0ACB7SWA5_HYAAI|nr:hypothetical protein HPB50_018582 [Hyalomma asiaticum]
MSVPGKQFARVVILGLLLGHEQYRVYAAEARCHKDAAPLDLRILEALEKLVDALGSRLPVMYVDAASGLYFAGVSQGVLQHNFWTDPPLPAGVEPAENASGSAPHHDVNALTSDACITQVFSSSLCRDVNTTCWETMTGGRHNGYGLTHQVLFLTIALKVGNLRQN